MGHTLSMYQPILGGKKVKNMYPMYPQQQAMHHTNQPMQVVVVEPYVYAAVQSLLGKRVVIDTSRGPINGIIRDAKPDHVVVQERDSTFFVRLCEVIWIMPEND